MPPMIKSIWIVNAYLYILLDTFINHDYVRLGSGRVLHTSHRDRNLGDRK